MPQHKLNLNSIGSPLRRPGSARPGVRDARGWFRLGMAGWAGNGGRGGEWKGRDWVGVHGGEGRVDRTSKGRVEYKVGK